MQSTRRPYSASATPRFSVVVVFATPPFWFASANTRVVAGAFAFPELRNPGRVRRRATAISAVHSRELGAFLHGAPILDLGIDPACGPPRRRSHDA